MIHHAFLFVVFSAPALHLSSTQMTQIWFCVNLGIARLSTMSVCDVFVGGECVCGGAWHNQGHYLCCCLPLEGWGVKNASVQLGLASLCATLSTELSDITLKWSIPCYFHKVNYETHQWISLLIQESYEAVMNIEANAVCRFCLSVCVSLYPTTPVNAHVTKTNAGRFTVHSSALNHSAIISVIVPLPPQPSSLKYRNR